MSVTSVCFSHVIAKWTTIEEFFCFFFVRGESSVPPSCKSLKHLTRYISGFYLLNTLPKKKKKNEEDRMELRFYISFNFFIFLWEGAKYLLSLMSACPANNAYLAHIYTVVCRSDCAKYRAVCVGKIR